MQARPDIPVEHGRDRPLELAEPRRYPAGNGHEHPWRHAVDQLLYGQLMGRVRERPQERHRHAVEPVTLDESGDRVRGPGLVQGHHDLPGRVHPLVQFQDRPGDDQRRGQRGAAHPEYVLHAESGGTPVPAHDGQGVAVADGRDDADPGTGSFEHRVRADRRAVPESPRPVQQFRPRQAEARGQLGQTGQHSLRRISPRGERLRRAVGHGPVGARTYENAVGGRPPDINADVEHRDLLPYAPDRSIDRVLTITLVPFRRQPSRARVSGPRRSSAPQMTAPAAKMPAQHQNTVV